MTVFPRLSVAPVNGDIVYMKWDFGGMLRRDFPAPNVMYFDPESY